MAAQRSNPFYVVLGLVGFLFTITATSYCLSVLRGVRPAAAAAAAHPLEAVMNRHGTAILAGELAVLAIATFGAVAVDHFAGERQRRDRAAADRAHAAASGNPPAGTGEAGP